MTDEKFDKLATEMLAAGFSERECIERALEYSCDYMAVADYIEAILRHTRADEALLKQMAEALEKALVENNTGDKHNDYDGLYHDVEQALAAFKGRG